MESVATTKKHKSLKKGFYPSQGPNRRQRRQDVFLTLDTKVNNRKRTLGRMKRVQVIPTSLFLYQGAWLPIGKLPHKLLLDPEKQNKLPRMIVRKRVIHELTSN